MSTLHQLYLTEIGRQRGKFLSVPASTFQESEIAGLPEPLRRYFHVCGYIGREKQFYSQVGWDQVEMKLPPGGKWRKMDCYQFNSVPDPMRIMHIKFRYWGIFPFEARDKYQDGHGNLLIRLCRLVTIGDLRGKEVDASELVTLLSEALLLPAYAVQPYIRWSAIAADRVGAELSWNGTRVHGLFFFNSRGEFERFETTDRWKAAGRGRFEPMAWSVRVSDYVTRNGVRQPSRAAAAWLENGQWTDYFKGEITGTSGLAPA